MTLKYKNNIFTVIKVISIDCKNHKIKKTKTIRKGMMK